MKNWKSTLAFFVFVGVYIYSVAIPSTNEVVSTAGWIALIASIAMMFRSQITADMLSKLIDKLPNKD